MYSCVNFREVVVDFVVVEVIINPQHSAGASFLPVTCLWIWYVDLIFIYLLIAQLIIGFSIISLLFCHLPFCMLL